MRSRRSGSQVRPGAGGLRRATILALGAALVAGGCGSGQAELPPPRSLVIFSGARISPDPERLQEVHEWVTEAVRTIEEDPSFFLETRFVPEPRYPWETLVMAPDDTVRIALEQSAPDARTSYWVYAFLHQMRRMDRLVDWFEETEFMEGFELERFIVARTADSWLLGRATFDTQPYRPLDELIYANEAGLLENMLLYLRGEEFPEAKERFLAENPDGLERFVEWYRETFGEDPPGGG